MGNPRDELELLIDELTPPKGFRLEGKRTSAARREDLGIRRAASVLGMNVDKVERMVQGRSRGFSRSDQNKIRAMSAKAPDFGKLVSRASRGTERETRVALRETAKISKKMSAATRRRIVAAQTKILDKDNAPTIYERGS